MGSPIDLTGRRFGKLVVVNIAERRTGKGLVWHCQCDCGKTKNIPSYTLHDYVSCGCTKRERALNGISRTHGMTNSREFSSWSSMLSRCYNPNAKSYDSYGGRGIKVCNEWRNSFITFYQDMGSRPPNKTLDRRDNNGKSSKLEILVSTV